MLFSTKRDHPERSTMRRVRRMLAALAAGLTVALSLSVGAASPAAAIGGETFGCRVSPGSDFEWRQVCHNTMPASRYNAGFALQNLSGGDYTFDWRIEGRYTSIFVGCTATSSSCGVWTPGSSSESEVTVTVTYTQNGQSATRSATAYIFAYCSWGLC
jgi:hypothetical protein